MMGSAARIEQARRLGPRARIVQHATLRTGGADEQAPLRFALEDALATADFGDCGRLLLVRRLQLRQLPTRAGPVLLARALETAWHAQAAHALPHHHPQAAQAQAVYFASRFEARLAWLQCMAQGKLTDAWFWRAALPELSSDIAPSDQVGGVLIPLLQEAPEPARQALTRWRDHDLITLARAMSPATLDAWRAQLEASPYSPPAPAPKWAETGAGVLLPTATLLATAQRLHQDPSVSPAVTAWLAAMWLNASLGRQPTSSEVQQVLTEVFARSRDQALFAMATTVARATQEGIPPEQRPLSNAAPPSESAHVGPPAIGPAQLEATPPAAPAKGIPAPSEHEPPGHAPLRQAPGFPTPTAQYRPIPRPPAHATGAWPWLADAQPSGHAGLLLLLNLLHALGFEPWLGAQPVGLQQAFVHALLSHVLDHCGAPARDPQRAWLASAGPEQIALASGRFDGDRLTLPQAIRLWRVRMRRTLRRHAGLDLTDAVNRTGWLSTSATHLDVIYPLDEVMLPLRRLGLDCDPGWVSWFGHIVVFHFLSRQQLPAPIDRGRDG